MATRRVDHPSGAPPADDRPTFRSSLASLLPRSSSAGRGITRRPTLQRQARTAQRAFKTSGPCTTCSTLLCTLAALACTLHRMRTATVASSPANASWPVAQARMERLQQPPFMNKNYILALSTKRTTIHNRITLIHVENSRDIRFSDRRNVTNDRCDERPSRWPLVGMALDDKNNHTHTHKQPTYIQILRTLTLHSTAIA